MSQSHETDERAETAASNLSYEEARAQLIEVVNTLESGGTSLTESLALWEKGEQLAAACQDALNGARARMDAAADKDDD